MASVASTLHSFPNYSYDMGLFKKYVCSCECIYDLFGRVRNNTRYVHAMYDDGFEELYKPTYGTSMPEVIYHDSYRQMYAARTTINKNCETSDGKEPAGTTPHETNHTLQKRDPLPITLPPSASDITLASDSDSYYSETDSLNFIVSESDLPDQDVWDIL